MFALGLTVNRLIRISYGPFRLGDLQPGEVSEVKGRVLRDQLGFDPASDDEPPAATRPGTRRLRPKPARNADATPDAPGPTKPGPTRPRPTKPAAGWAKASPRPSAPRSTPSVGRPTPRPPRGDGKGGGKGQ